MSRYIDADKLVQDLSEFYANVDCRWQRGRDMGLGINTAYDTDYFMGQLL